MNDPVIRFPATRIPLYSRAVSAGFGAAAQRLVIVLGVVVTLLAFLAILCELRGLRSVVEQKATKETKGAIPSLASFPSVQSHLEGGGR